MDGTSQIGPYKFLMQLGQGAHGKVFLAEHTRTKDHVAIKCIPKCNLKGSRLQRFHVEVSLMKSIDFPMIAQLFQVLEDRTYHYLVLEFVQKNSLSSLIKTTGRMIEPTARKYFLQLMATLEYLHNDKRIMHRDLKAENILLDKNSNIRLVDFGLSRTFTETTPELNTRCGTLEYLPPEMILKRPYTTAADIWSAGVLLYFLVVGRFPFDSEDANQIARRILHSPVEYPTSLSPAVIDLLKKMLQKRPEDRIHLEKIKEHPWFSCMEFTAMQGRLEELQQQFLEYDTIVVQNMERKGIDISSLKQKLFLNDFEDETVAIYRIRHRARLTDEMRGLTLVKSGSSGYLPKAGALPSEATPPSPLIEAGPFVPQSEGRRQSNVGECMLRGTPRPIAMARFVRREVTAQRRKSHNFPIGHSPVVNH